MKTLQQKCVCLAGLLALLSAPAFGLVRVTVLKPSLASPQTLGTPVTWRVEAKDTAKGPLTFQFKVAPPGGRLALVKDFNVGTKNRRTGVWTPPTPFLWTPTGIEGQYRIEVVIKDFGSGHTSSKSATFQVNPLATGTIPVVAPTVNPLVALLGAPACPSGSTMRVTFQPASGTNPAMNTNWVPCDGVHTMNFEIAGMYPSTAYSMIAQTMTSGTSVNSTPVSFTTGALPAHIPFPKSKVVVGPGPNTDTQDGILLHSITRLGGGVYYPDVATDLAGSTLWYYRTSSATHANLLTRPLQGGGILSIELGPNWNPSTVASQIIRQLDLAGNIVRETNTGILQQQVLALGDPNGAPCTGIAKPAPVGTACMGGFHHEVMQALPNGDTAVLLDIEKVFPAGTQGDTTGLPVDIVGDMILVLDSDWQVKWYFDTFQHAGGAPELDINRAAVLNETCYSGFGGCPPLFLSGNGIAPKAHDWLHGNTVYYWPQTHDLLFSSRHQDWVVKIDYNDGAGTGKILWRMGPGGDFTLNSPDTLWPWFSHQHEIAMEQDGAGPMSIFDNGNTRVSPPTGAGSSTGPIPGLGGACHPSGGPNDCNSRGMALNVDEANMQVTAVLSQDLGYYSTAMGSAQLLYNGNYFFLPALVPITAKQIVSFSQEIMPTTGVSGAQVLNVQGPEVYRSWQMPSMYAPPIS